MAPIKKNEIITEGAIKAPLELADNFGIADKEAKQLIETLDNLVKKGKAADVNLDIAKSTKEVSKETQNLTLAQKELEKIDKQILTAQIKQNDEFVKKQKELKEVRAETKRLVNEEGRLLGEEEKLIKANKELLQQRRQLVKTDQTYADQVAEINKQIDANNEAIKENLSAQEEQRSQVGAYREQLEGLGVTISGVSEQGGAVVGFFGKLAGGIDAGTKASLRFIATPIGAVIAAIVAGIALLTAAVTNNQAAADEFNEIWGGVTEVLDEVFSRIVRLGTALFKFLQGDFSGAAEEASAAFDDLSGSLARAFEEGQKLVRLQIELEKATIAATVATAALEGEIELLNITVGNGTKSFAEREAAAASARQKEAELAKINLDLAQQELDIINIQVAAAVRRGTINRELQQEQADALANFIEVSNAARIVEAQNQLEIDQLKQDRLEKDLDILIDGFDNVKTINERIINDDKRTVRNRQEGLDQLVQLGEDSFNQQIETIRKFTKVRFDENELLAEQDAVVLNERIRGLGLSEIIEGRLLEVIRERRLVLADVAEIEQTLQQAQIDRLQEIADNEKNITDERIQALLDLGDIRLSILDQQLEQGVVNEQEFAEKVENIQQELADKINELNLRRFDDDFSDEALDRETERINQLIDLNEQFRNGEIESVEEFERRKIEIEAEGQRQSLEQQLEYLEERKSLLENAGVDTSAIEKSIAEVRLKLSEITGEKLLQDEEALQEALKDLRQTAADAALDIVESRNEVEDERRAERLEQLQEEETAAIEAAGDNEQAKEGIKIEFAKRRKAIEDEQAKAERKRAIFDKALAATNIAINTAVAIGKAVAASPLTGGLPFSAIAGAIGAVQLAAVLARPIPAFAKGTKSAPGGLKMINEEGGESWVTPSGELRYAGDTGAIIVGDETVPAGSTIFTKDETSKMMSNPIDFSNVGGALSYKPRDRDPAQSMVARGLREIAREQRKTANIIKNKKEYRVKISKHATDKLTKSGENWNRILNEDYK